MGHFFVAKILGVEVKKIIIYPLGGVSKFKVDLNAPFIVEFLILIAGPLAQFFAYFILLRIMNNYKNIIEMYHYGILIFNLLPIYPLDGGRLLNLFLLKFFSFKRAFKITFIISYIMIIFILMVNYGNIGLNLIIMGTLLIYKVSTYSKKINYIYNKFLLERYLNKYKFKRAIIIRNYEDFYKGKRHLIRDNDKYYLEEEYLNNKFRGKYKILSNE